jgi:hypothetical protein
MSDRYEIEDGAILDTKEKVVLQLGTVAWRLNDTDRKLLGCAASGAVIGNEFTRMKNKLKNIKHIIDTD